MQGLPNIRLGNLAAADQELLEFADRQSRCRPPSSKNAKEPTPSFIRK